MQNLTFLVIYSFLATVLVVVFGIQNHKLKAPKDQKVDYTDVQQVEFGNAPSIGPEQAPIQIAVFSDFECPYCAGASKNLSRLLEKYPDQIRLAFKNYTLDFHPNAKLAARAALAAHVEGRFWEMEEKLMANGKQLSEEKILELATELGLERENFKQTMMAPHWEEVLMADLEQAMALGVKGTPTIFVNGVKVPGSYEGLTEAVDHFLADQVAKLSGE